MSTYRVPEYTGTLDFAEGYWEGADVEVRLTVPLGVYFEVLESVDSGDVSKLRRGLERWASAALVSWNLVDDAGEPIPATAEGFMCLPLVPAMDLVRTWLTKVPAIDLPSGGGSPGTATSTMRRAQKRQRST